MPRFFFHLHNDVDAEDHEGRELIGPEAARDFAVENIRSLICESVQEGRLNLSHHIDVADEQGQIVMRVRFADALTIEGTDESQRLR